MKVLRRISLSESMLRFMLVMMMVLACGTTMGQEDEKKKQAANDEFTLEEITVTAQFTETNLQKTPIAITAIPGETLEMQNIMSVKDLGLVIPNSDIRSQGNLYGPNAQIGLRGVGQTDFIPAFEPGVGVYIDDVYQETMVGSTLDLLDLERVEVLRGPQGTLFGKNSLGGAMRLISKAPRGDNTGHLQVTYGDYDRLDFSGGYDFSLIKDKLFARISASSKRIDGYMDRLDYTCQMIANGTPELAGSLPSTILNNKISSGDCKIGEKGGSQSDAGKIMLRWLPTTKLEFNLGVDHTRVEADPSAETLLKGTNPTGLFDGWVQANIIDPMFNTNEGDALTILGDQFVTGNPYTVYESFEDPINGTRWPDKTKEDYTNMFGRVDYDITDNIHLKGIFGYREYEQQFTTANYTPFSFNAYYIDMEHSQTSYELRLNGTAFNKRLDWTTGIYYFESDHQYGGYIGLGTFGMAYEALFGVPYPKGFTNNDAFTTESKSAFSHFIFKITDKLSLTAGGRYTDEDKTFTFDHGDLLQIDKPLQYGASHYDWKLSVDYQFTETIMTYIMASTGYRSEGANPRPYTRAQLLGTPSEEILAYELGAKTQFFDNRLRVNAPVFLNKYDPRLYGRWGSQCNDPNSEVGEYVWGFMAICPEGTLMAGTSGTYAYAYSSAAGTSKGLELDVMARLFEHLHLNGSFGYYNYESDVSSTHPGYIHPDYKQTAEYSYNMGAQYDLIFNNGSMLSPRLDMFYQGERSNGTVTVKPDKYTTIPDYTVYNARITYMPSSLKWSVSLEVQNLFDKFYWITVTSESTDGGVTPSYGRYGQPSPPRMIALTVRWNLF
jgi:iron complex outermembrane recepter protein